MCSYIVKLSKALVGQHTHTQSHVALQHQYFINMHIIITIAHPHHEYLCSYIVTFQPLSLDKESKWKFVFDFAFNLVDGSMLLLYSLPANVLSSIQICTWNCKWCICKINMVNVGSSIYIRSQSPN